MAGASVDLTGAEVGEWTVAMKAPAQNRVRMWTVAHKACGGAADVPQTVIQSALKGKGTIPPCATCTPAEALPAVSHGMHLECGQTHLLGTPCPTKPPATLATLNERLGITVERVATPDGPTGAAIIRPAAPSDPYEPKVLVQGGRALAPHEAEAGRALEAGGPAPGDLPVLRVDLDALPDEPEPIEPHPYGDSYTGMLCGAMLADADGFGTTCGLPAEHPAHSEPACTCNAADLATYAGPYATCATHGEPELPSVVEAVLANRAQAEESLRTWDLDRGQHVPDPVAPSVIVSGPCDRLEAPQDYLEIIREAMGGYSTNVPDGLTPSSPGASSLGGCERRLGFRLAFGKQPFEPSWPARVGTNTHTWLEEVFATHGAVLPDGSPRWLSGHWITDPITCPLDLFDVLHGRVIDFKVPGTTTVREARAGRVAEKYKTQTQILGLGLEREGYAVRSVALLFLPASGHLKDAAWWEAPYDPAAAWAALARRDRISAMLTVADPERVLEVLEATEDHCGSCPALGAHCPGAQARPAPALTLARPA